MPFYWCKAQHTVNISNRKGLEKAETHPEFLLTQFNKLTAGTDKRIRCALNIHGMRWSKGRIQIKISWATLLQWAFVDIGHRIDGYLCTYTGRAAAGGSGPKRSVQRAGAHRSARKGFATGKREEEGRWGIKRVRNQDKRKKKVGKHMQMVLGEGTYLDIESRAATER